MKKTNKLPASTVIESIDGFTEIELWDAEAYGSDNTRPIFGLKVTSIDEGETESLVDKKDIGRIIKFLKSIQ